MKSIIQRWLLVIWCFFLSILRSMFKRFLRITTTLCELQRICYATERGAERTLKVEQSLERSKSVVINRLRNRLNDLASIAGKFSTDNTYEVAQTVEFAVEAICDDKHIKPQLHSDFLIAMRVALLQIYGYRHLQTQILQLKCIAYDADNANHEQKLMQLWSNLMPDEPLESRISKQWMTIGFQGNDPKTDFRGMGLLGLENLLYLSNKYSAIARHILSHSNHPVHGYPFAITGINITHIAYTLLNSGKLKTHFYNTYYGTLCVEDFHKVYCYLFFHFDKHWLQQKPRDVMEFRHIKEIFLDALHEKLLDTSQALKWDPNVEII